MKHQFVLSLLLLGAGAGLTARSPEPGIVGDYLEVRTCDVYTGACVANAEMGLTGKEGILVWSVRQGTWGKTELNGLSVIAVVEANGTLGDVRYQPRQGKAVLILDGKANTEQRAALKEFAQSMAGSLVQEVADIKTATIQASIGTCGKAGCAAIKAGDLVQVSTRCLGDKDHLCGNEETYYPPLTPVLGAYPVFTEVAQYQGGSLDATWQSTGKRSAFLASFAR